MNKTAEIYADSFAKLIRVPTVTNSDRANFAEFRKVLSEEFPLVHKTCEVIRPGGEGSDALLFKWKGKSSDRPVVLMAHQDVVPAKGGEWKYDPYSGEIAEGKIWGRGTMDCKNSLFCSIQSVEDLIGEGFVPEQDIYLSFSDNEETSGPGAGYAKDWFIKNNVKPVMAVDEGGAIVDDVFPGMLKPVCTVGIIEKGYCDIRFTARSAGGHSSMPPKHSPMARIAKFIDYCETHKIFESKMSPAAKAMLKGLSPCLPSPLNFVTKHAGFFSPVIVGVLPKLAPFGRALLGTTMIFTMTQASHAPNVIPQAASVVANLRIAPGENVDDCVEKMRKIAAKYDIETEVIIARSASPMVDINCAEYKYFTDTVTKIFPDVGTSPYLMFGGTDCRTMQEIIPCALRCTPFRLDAQQMAAMHAANENIDIASLIESLAFFKLFLKEYK